MANNILFITGTRIGDAILSSGLLAHLVETHPDARFTVACGAPAAPLFRAAPRLVESLLRMRLGMRLGMGWDVRPFLPAHVHLIACAMHAPCMHTARALHVQEAVQLLLRVKLLRLQRAAQAEAEDELRPQRVLEGEQEGPLAREERARQVDDLVARLDCGLP